MKLTELAATKPTQQINKVFESYFGTGLAVDNLSGKQAKAMLKKVQQVLGETRRQPSFHRSEKNASYLKLVMLEQALGARVMETMPAPAVPAAPAAPGAPATPQQSVAGGKPAVAGAVAKDPKLAAALKKSTAGQPLNPEEQKLVAGAAMMQAENRLSRAYRTLKESEVQQAQVVLAAQDMVDKMQKMIEDTTSLQFKELPALVDSIKNQVGIDQAQQFNTDATAALSGLVQNLQASKQQMEQALGVVTGQAVAPDANIGAMAGAEMGAEMGGEGGAAPDAEMGADLGAEVGDDLETGEQPAPAAALGRARR
jgi:hypothetical protein